MNDSDRLPQKASAPVLGLTGMPPAFLAGVASAALQQAGQYEDAKEMAFRVFSCSGYSEALDVISNYATLVVSEMAGNFQPSLCGEEVLPKIQKVKPAAPLYMAEGNSLKMVGIASAVLKEAGLRESAHEMGRRALAAGNDQQIAEIIRAYVDEMTPEHNGEWECEV